MTKSVFLVASSDRFPGLLPRSTARIAYDRFIHSFNYPYTIHPYSTFRYYWDCSMCISIFLHISILMILQVLQYHITNAVTLFLTLLFQIHGLMDVVLNFFTGYVEKSNDNIAVLLLSKIVKKYLKTWFLMDIFPIVPGEIYAMITNFACVAEPFYHYFSDFVSSCFFPFFVLFFRYPMRLITFHRYVHKIVMMKLINIFRVQILLFCFYAWTIIFTFVHINYFTPQIFLYRNDTWLGYNTEFCDPNRPIIPKSCKVLIHSYIWQLVFSFFSLIHENIFYGKDNFVLEILYRTLFFYVTILGLTFLWAFFINNALSDTPPRKRFYEFMNNIDYYGKQKKLPQSLHQKMRLYYESSMEKKYFEDEILEFLPQSEKMKITLRSTLLVIQKNPIFMDLPQELLKELACLIREEIYLPQHVLVQAGEYGKSMFFIKYGTVAVYSTKLVKLTEFDDGDFFGVKSIIFPEKVLNASVVAVKLCSVYRLDKVDFLEAIQAFPGYLDHLQMKIYVAKGFR